MGSISPREPLATLLEALDKRDPERLQRVAARDADGPLLAACAHHGLDDREVLLVLAALAARLSGNGSQQGDELCVAAADDSAGRLEALQRLDGDGRLVRAGFLVPEVVPTHPAEAHVTGFRLGEHAFRLACESIGRPCPPASTLPEGGYRGNSEALGDLRRLSLHYRRRAARLFHLDPWTGTGVEVLDGTETLCRRAAEEARRVASRQRATPSDLALPVLRLKADERLDLDALVILATVLFQELFDGIGAVDAVDLVKLVSESEADLLRRRALLRPLAARGLLRLEGAYEDKELTADASLPPAVVARMLGDEHGIDPEARAGFHAYLEQLDGSDPFFLDLEGGGFP